MRPVRLVSRRLRSLLGGLAVTTALLVGLELAARVLDLPQGVIHDAEGRLYRNHPTLFWVMRRDVDVIRDDGLEVRTNELGLRSPPIDASHRRARVISLGESSTFGAGVRAEETYTAQLGQLLEVEPVNASVPGYTSWQSAVWFDEVGRSLDPQVVLFYHQHNDQLPAGVTDDKNYLYRVTGTDREMYEARLRWRGFLSIAYQSRAYLYARGWLLRHAGDPQAGKGEAGSSPRVRVPDPDRASALEWIARGCVAPTCRLVVLQPVYAVTEPDAVLRDTAARLGVTYLNLTRARRASGLTDAQFFSDGIHPTAAGHRALAEAIARTVTPLLPLAR